jgi:adenine C2-methylase RlmN of 23S rRNA A2503 and tRNA A37
MDFLGAYQDRQDLVQKYVFKDQNGIVEVSHIHNKDRDTYCLPSMYMCKLGCKFCHCTTEGLEGYTGPIAFETIKEILGRIPRNRPQVLYSIMGMGDPLLNLDMVCKLKDSCEFGERVAISTIFPKLDETPFIPEDIKIHYSLHSPFDEKRKALITSQTFSVENVLFYLDGRKEKEIHYTLIHGVNDGMEDLRELTRLLTTYAIPIKFLTFNETGGMIASQNLDIWVNTLQKIVRVEEYAPPGQQIGSSCGEFTKYFYKDTNSEEFKRFEKKCRLF